jgi:hypothetical protein
MISLDKEIAEEKSETLEAEVASLKEELEIVKTDLQIKEEESKKRAELRSTVAGEGVLLHRITWCGVVC